jgi:hypothetical protein
LRWVQYYWFILARCGETWQLKNKIKNKKFSSSLQV